MRPSGFPRVIHLKWVVFVLSLACSALSLLFILSPLVESAIAAHWRADSIVLLCALAGLSVGAFLARRPAPILVLLAVRILVVGIVGLPFGNSILVEVPLWSSVFLESGGYLATPASFLMQGLCLLVAFLSQARVPVWGEVVSGSPILYLAASAVLLVGIAVLLFFLRAFAAVSRKREEQSARLDEAVRQLTVANLSFQRLVSTTEERSADDERKRITREIHDAIGYALTNLIMIMEAAMRMAPKEAAGLRGVLLQAREEAQVGLNETRKALRLLRVVNQERVQGLAAIQRLATLFSKATGVEVKVEYRNADWSFGEAADLIVYRMIQEGMINAFRHGHATLISVHFWQDESGLQVRLWDNGTGGESVKEGLGLSGMRERIERIRGTLHASRVADGFELIAWLPLAKGGERTAPRAQDIASSR